MRTTKTLKCAVCGKRKALSKFQLKGKVCITCKSEYDKKYYQENRERILARTCAYEKTEVGRECNRLASAKYGANGKWAELNKVHIARVKADPEKWKEYLFKKRAHNAVRYALKTGKLVKPVKCEWCGREDVLEAHHEDYEKKLEVAFLCKICHCGLRRLEYKGV